MYKTQSETTSNLQIPAFFYSKREYACNCSAEIISTTQAGGNNALWNVIEDNQQASSTGGAGPPGVTAVLTNF